MGADNRKTDAIARHFFKRRYPCYLGHFLCAGSPGGPCRERQTNSNPKTQARQKKRRRT